MVHGLLHVRQDALGIGITGSTRKPVQPFIDLLEVLRKNSVLLQRFPFPSGDLLQVLLLVVPQDTVPVCDMYRVAISPETRSK